MEVLLQKLQAEKVKLEGKSDAASQERLEKVQAHIDAMQKLPSGAAAQSVPQQSSPTPAARPKSPGGRRASLGKTSPRPPRADETARPARTKSPAYAALIDKLNKPRPAASVDQSASLTREPALAAASRTHSDAIFDKMDADGNGEVTPSEFREALTQQPAMREHVSSGVAPSAPSQQRVPPARSLAAARAGASARPTQQGADLVEKWVYIHYDDTRRLGQVLSYDEAANSHEVRWADSQTGTAAAWIPAVAPGEYTIADPGQSDVQIAHLAQQQWQQKEQEQAQPAQPAQPQRSRFDRSAAPQPTTVQSSLEQRQPETTAATAAAASENSPTMSLEPAEPGGGEQSSSSWARTSASPTKTAAAKAEGAQRYRAEKAQSPAARGNLAVERRIEEMGNTPCRSPLSPS